MKHKVSDLKGALLDAAVAKAEDTKPRKVLTSVTFDADTPPTFRMEHLPYSRSWQHGGPIIQREQIAIFSNGPEAWRAGFDLMPGDDDDLLLTSARDGQTPLIAAMRAYVASKFGEEIEL